MAREISVSATNYPDIIQNIAEQTNLATDIAAKLRACANPQQIFETAVRWARQSTDCDRAVIYSLQAQDRGTIIAESVDGNYPQTLGRTIVDPCFEARYIDKYQQGRVRAIANIHQAGMTPCYIENLEKIGVQASLVVPLLGAANHLHGLLVLHQCSSTRHWSQADIDLAINIATHSGHSLEYLAQVQECDRLRAELQQAAAWQQILPKIEKKLRASCNRIEVLQIAVQQAQSLLQCDRVVAYSLQASSQGKIIAEATQNALAPLIGRTIYDPCFDYRYTEKYQNGRVRAIDNIFQAGMTPCYIETLSNIGVKSNLVAPILVKEQLVGLLVAHHCFEFRTWQPEEIAQFQQLADRTGLALNAARLQEKQFQLRSTIATVTAMEGSLRQALGHSQQVSAVASELTKILGEVHTISRLLDRECQASPAMGESDPAEARRLLQVIARRLHSNVETWQSIQEQWPLQQSEATRLLAAALAAIESL
jgi:GAF domain-containing protein